jgi:hypothetical protein
VRCVQADLLDWEPDRTYDVWHDRAVFHFLVDAADRKRYRSTMRRAVARGGVVVVGTFAADGPRVCSGLPVCRYAAGELGEELGEGVDVIATRREVHVTPRGVLQPFTWVAARLG